MIVLGTLRQKVCGFFSEPAFICDGCGSVTTKEAFDRTGCKVCFSFPGCGRNNELGIVVGTCHDVPTYPCMESKKRGIDKHLDRLVAIRERKAASWAKRNNKRP